MAYGDLLRALSDETERDARSIRDAGAREAERVVAEARAAAAAEGERALAAVEAQERSALARARAAARRDAEATVLREVRRRLEALRAEALSALRARGRTILPRLVDELCGRLSPGTATLVVDPGGEAVVLEHLARAHPDLADRLTVRAAATARGGVELVQDGVVLDDTLEGRLDRAWDVLEPELAKLHAGATRGDD
jgi:V/A-type H+/Na+-transporting ATPase subunit E